MRHRLAGDNDGYYHDFDGTTESLAAAMRDGWTFSGEYASFHGHGRGTSPEGLSLESRVFCIQNHDQIGNRAFGDRLSTQISYSAWCAASALLLLSPEVPLLFMGQEWAASGPFLFFTDHNEELGRMVTEGRRKEFSHFSAFADVGNHATIPDPQKLETFLQSKLDWKALASADHSKCLHWYQTLLHIRKRLLGVAEFESARALNEQVVAVSWRSARGVFRAIVALEGSTTVNEASFRTLTRVCGSEENRFIEDPHPIDWNSETGTLSFERAGAVLVASGDLVDIAEERTQ
jgi:maltooligosyltrehalose trehalohydrolase